MFFSPYSLKHAGLIVQLGHDGNACPHSNPQDVLLTVLNISGIHHIRYALCSCERAGASTSLVQLMWAQWWPATILKPCTAVTFCTLRFFHTLAAQGKVNAYDYYNGLMHITDGTGFLVINVSIPVNAFHSRPHLPSDQLLGVHPLCSHVLSSADGKACWSRTQCRGH